MDPFTELVVPSLGKAAPVPILVVIPIDASVQDPSPGPGPATFLKLNGSVSCSLTGVETDPVAPVVKVGLATSIRITPFGIGTPAWIVSATSTDNVTVLPSGSVLLDKHYVVSGNADLMLHMRFKITSTIVTVSEMWFTISPIVGGDS